MADFTKSGIVVFRRRVPHTCPICGAGFTAYTTAVYCSNRCRQADKYQRGKVEKPGTPQGTPSDVLPG